MIHCVLWFVQYWVCESFLFGFFQSHIAVYSEILPSDQQLRKRVKMVLERGACTIDYQEFAPHTKVVIIIGGAF